MSEEIAVQDTERIDRAIWRGIGAKSARQIAEETGTDPAYVLRRRNELLEAVDDLSIKQAKQKLLADLQSISTRTQEDYDAADYEFKAGLMNSSIAAIKAVLVELNRADKADTEKVNHLNTLRVRELVSLIREVVDISVDEISEAYGIDKDELFAIFNTNLDKAARIRDAIAP